MTKTDGVRVHDTKKSDEVRVHHETRPGGVRVHDEKKSNEVRAHHKKEG